MILIGGLLILAVIADGIRRVLADRRDAIRMSLSHQRDDGEFDDFNPELPNGGARSLERSELDTNRAKARYPKQETPAPVSRPAEPKIEPEAVAATTRAEPDPVVETVQSPAPQARPETLVPAPEEVLIINVLSRDNNGFNGADLLEVLLACDVRFGDMDIFHRYEGAQGQGRIQFSVANLVKPGTFDLETIREFYTPGISLFLQLPGPEDSLGAFDCMAETASCLVKNLQGEMRDEGHSVLTAQTLEHYRERIRDYERKRLMQAAHRSA